MKFTWPTGAAGILFALMVIVGSWAAIPAGIAVAVCAGIDYRAHRRRAVA